ncbi:MAG: NAD-dependent epimerase/dehydratase family protein [Chloroflexi bacterium]|nr:NAD-dependent epimerase/dehydratase family protein [Chloroflexota bacterium]
MTVIRGKRVFITGGAGFIASHLIERLLADNEVVVYDNLHRNALQFSNLQEHPNLHFVKGDVLDAAHLGEAMAGSEICIHAAAIAGIYSVGTSLTRTMKVNLLGVYHALEAALAHKVERFVDFSTSEVYGPFVYRGKETDRTTMGPVGERRWIYAVSKLAGEHFTHAYGEDFGLDVVSLRPFNVYGPRQVGEGAVQQMVHRALRGEDITVFNDGTQIRSWCYVTDFVDGLYRAMHDPAASRQTFNIGNPQATITVLGLAETIVRLTGSSSTIVFKPHPGPEVEMRVPDITNATDLLGFRPAVTLEEGLRRAIAWYSESASLAPA